MDAAEFDRSKLANVDHDRSGSARLQPKTKQVSKTALLGLEKLSNLQCVLQ